MFQIHPDRQLVPQNKRAAEVLAAEILKGAKPLTTIPDTPAQSAAFEPRPDFVPIIRDQSFASNPSKVAALRPDLAALVRDQPSVSVPVKETAIYVTKDSKTSVPVKSLPDPVATALQEEFPDSEPVLHTDINPPCIPVVNQEKGDEDEEEELVYDPSLDKPNPGEVEDEAPTCMPKATDMKKNHLSGVYHENEG